MLLTVVEAKGSLFVRPALLMHPKLWLETLYMALEETLQGHSAHSLTKTSGGGSLGAVPLY